VCTPPAQAVQAADTCHRTHALTHALTHSRTHSLTHALTHARTHSRTHSLTHALTHARTHSRTHSCTHARADACVDAWVMGAHTHTYTHTHTHRGAAPPAAWMNAEGVNQLTCPRCMFRMAASELRLLRHVLRSVQHSLQPGLYGTHTVQTLPPYAVACLPRV
jgi:hypothetical protein